MPLYRVTFTEQDGYRCQCRIRASAIADHVTLAVQKVWGPAAVWVPTSATEGRVYVSVGDEEDDLIPRTAPTTVAVQPGTRRRVPLRCVVCHVPETLATLKLCDGPGRWANTTCDTPVCVDHAAHVDPDTDYCPRHAALARATPSP